MVVTNVKKGAMLVCQSGGPSSVINASLYGVVKTALASEQFSKVYAGMFGVESIFDEKFIDMSKIDKDELALLMQTPAAAAGSSRCKIKTDEQREKIIEIFKKYDIRYFFFIGGNDSMDTSNKISLLCKKIGYDCKVIGVPKTIDNDLTNTDFSPGYGSAAKYVATIIGELAQDATVYKTGQVVVVEVMGRDSGWLTAAAALPSQFGKGADLIYLPETVFCVEKFIQDIRDVLKTQKDVLVAVSEGVKDKDGTYIMEYPHKLAKDNFGHSQLGGLAGYLVSEAKKATGLKIRAIELSLLQRCAAHLQSKVDVDMAFLVGKTAVQKALAGRTNSMVGIVRVQKDGKVKFKAKLVPLKKVANAAKHMPLTFISKCGTNITQEAIDYILPIIQGEPKQKYENGLPKYINLR